MEGVELAVEDLNAGGGVLGRPVTLTVLPDESGAADPRAGARDRARALVREPSLIAVLGHTVPAGAGPASILYEDSGVLFLNATMADHGMHGFGFRYVFSTIPSDEDIIRQAATFCSSLGYRRIAILSHRDNRAAPLRHVFAAQATTLDMTIAVQRSFFTGRETFRDLLADLGAFPHDALLLLTDGAAAGAIIGQALEMSLNTHCVLGRVTDPVALRRRVGRETPRIAMPSLFNPYGGSPRVRRFRQAFTDRVGCAPDAWAAQGYDAMGLLAHAMRQANATVPLSIATVLRYTLAWRGLTGRHSFDRRGSIYTKDVAFATLEKGDILVFGPAGAVSPLPGDQGAPADAPCPRSSA
nr:ABC transporter substrate-binding protein [Roseospira visakhapatnamensis]